MTKMYDFQKVIDKYYPGGESGSEDACLRDIYMRHCRSVADLALRIARRNRLELAEDSVEAAAMLHDIGIVLTDAPGICCHGSEKYLAHGRLGAGLLRHEGAPELLARVAERHTGAGLTEADIARIGLDSLPSGVCYMPETLLERLICYADKFYSKSGDMKRKPMQRVEASIARFGADASLRFGKLRQEFGDVTDL